MVDVCIVINRNYDLLHKQLERWRHYPQFRLLFADNTPPNLRKPMPPVPKPHLSFVHNIEGDDGETHGGSLDLLVRETTTDIVGVCDADFFVVHPDPFGYIMAYFTNGCKAVGVEAINLGWINMNNGVAHRPEMLDRHMPGYMAPCVFCCFFTRELALRETFVVTHYEGRFHHQETGWRLRQAIYWEKIPNYVIRGFQYPGQQKILPDSWFYGTAEEPFGVHITAGSTNPNRANKSDALMNLSANYRRERTQAVKQKHQKQISEDLALLQ